MTKALYLLSLGAALPGAAMAQSAMTAIPVIAGTRLDVSAEGEVARAPDIATISAGVVTQATTAGAAMSENATRMAGTITALKRAGVADRDIQTSSLNLSPQYRYGENVPPVITGYQVSNQITVRFRDVTRAGRILDTLVAQGANQINGPSFSIDQADAAMDEARAQAMATARARAEIYARAAGLRVKRILSISEGGGATPPMPMPMMAMARRGEAADTQIQAGESKVSISVLVSFELE